MTPEELAETGILQQLGAVLATANKPTCAPAASELDWFAIHPALAGAIEGSPRVLTDCPVRPHSPVAVPFTKGGAECGTWRMRRPPPPAVHRPQGCDVGPAAPGRRASSSCWGAAADAAAEGEPNIARAVDKWTEGA